MPSEKKLVIGLCALLAAWLVGAYVFRDGLGLVVFIVLGVATLVQLARVLFLRGERKTLRDLWSACKDAFWGIG